jgi:hypothetical protein
MIQLYSMKLVILFAAFRLQPVIPQKGKAVTDAKMVLPIPEKVIQQNPAITQNSAYIQ